MNEHPDHAADPEGGAIPADDAIDGVEAVDKPARRKRAPKAAAPDADAVEGSVAASPEPEATPGSASDSQPVARPRRRKSAAPDIGDATGPVDAQYQPSAPAGGDASPSQVAQAIDGTDPISDAPAEASSVDESQPLADDAQRNARRQRRRGPRDEGSGPSEDTASHDQRAGESAEAPPREPDEPREPPVEVGEVFAQVLSGEFDVEPPADEVAAPIKRVLRPEPEAPKLHKVLAQSGIGSRRDMEQAILDGLVEVNGQVAHTGQRISFGDQIKVNGKPVRVRIIPPPPRIIAYHKPTGEVVTNDDPEHRPTVFRRLPRLPHGKWQSVGRLDMNTEGLLLFTNSGELANRLMHPRFGVEREYAVRVLGTLDAESKAMLLEGVDIDGQTASFRSIENGGGEGSNHWYRVVITEGRNREVRKLFEAVDLTVSRLIRIRYGCVVLPRGLKRGVWVDLDESDVRAIRRLAGGEAESAGRDGRGRDQPPRPQKGRDKPSNGPDRRQDRPPRPGFPDRDRNPNEARGPRPPHADAPPRVERAQPEERTPRDDDLDDDFDPSRIPNPLEQTFDKRFVQNPRSPAGGRGFRTGGGGFGAGGSAPPAQKKGDGPRQPDPMQTSVGYIGGDAFHRKSARPSGGGGGGGRGNNRGGGFGGGGGGGGGGRRGR